jgi:D-alanyl-D-alanine carboxypeptidase/D-alanyl-D-alanine-endopeptidase (penicillin-binding protein 4)
MRRLPLTAIAAAAALAALTPTAAQAQTGLQRALSKAMAQAGNSSGAYVVDLNTGAVVFSEKALTPRLPASVEKLYTTSTALLKFGPSARLTTGVYGTGALASNGTWNGTLFIRGGGDPSFGNASFDHTAYGGGATMQQLAGNLLHATGITALNGAIVGDESLFDSDRGTPATGNQPNGEVEGQLSALIYDRGFTSSAETAFQTHPAQFAAQAFAATLKADRVKVPARTPISAGVAPQSASLLGSVKSPSIGTLIDWTNAPSDNFFAEMLLKDVGAQFGAGGTTAAGVSVVKAELASKFGIIPTFNDGSGLSYADHTTPVQVVTLLSKMEANPVFVGSLAVAGQTGTLDQFVPPATPAYGNCRGKTGTLQAASNLAGYCTAANGDTLVFAFLMNSIDPNAAHPIQAQLIEDLANSKP